MQQCGFKCRIGLKDLTHVQPQALESVTSSERFRRGVASSDLAGYICPREGKLAGVVCRVQTIVSHRYPVIRRLLPGVTSLVLAPRIGAAPDIEERMRKMSQGMEPRFVSWNVSACHIFDFSFKEWKRGKTSEADVGTLERGLLEHQFSEDDDNEEVDGPLVLMTPS